MGDVMSTTVLTKDLKEQNQLLNRRLSYKGEEAVIVAVFKKCVELEREDADGHITSEYHKYEDMDVWFANGLAWWVKDDVWDV